MKILLNTFGIRVKADEYQIIFPKSDLKNHESLDIWSLNGDKQK